MIAAWTMRVAESGRLWVMRVAADELHQHRAGQRPDDAHPAAGQGRATDDDRRDGAELDEIAHERGSDALSRAVWMIPAIAASSAHRT